MSDMGYLISHIFICLLIAAIIGAIIGWLLRQWTYKPDVAYSGGGGSTNLSGHTNVGGAASATARGVAGGAAAAASAVGAATEGYPVEEIEGIGRVIGERLRSIQIDTTTDLLSQCQDAARCAEAASVAKVDESVMAQWVCAADLLRVPGVDGQFAELLETAGITKVQQLAGASANSLHDSLRRINEEQRRVPQLPTVNDVSGWITAAEQLPTVLT